MSRPSRMETSSVKLVLVEIWLELTCWSSFEVKINFKFFAIFLQKQKTV